MAGFDPDAYLAQKPFDPDAYLAEDKKGGVLQNVGNVAAGLVRGAGSIGATILTPFDMLMGNTQSIGNPERRKAMDEALGTLGAETDSFGYGAGKLAGEIAGTAGAPGVLAKGAQAMKAAPAVVEALRTGGLAANGLTGPKGMALRTAAGALGGGVSAGMVNPDDAATGAVIGGALPAVGKVAGEAGKRVGAVLRGPKQSEDALAAIKQAYDAGYVIPPTQAKPTLANRMLEGLSGKITTAQNASARNADVTNQLAAKAIGLTDDAKLTPDALEEVRKAAGAAYRDVASLPVRPAQEANSLMNAPAQPEINPAQMVFDLRKARNDATAWYNSYGRTADPESLAKAQAAKALASDLEGTLEGYAQSLGRDDLVSDMAKARQLIAKTYSVEKALNPTTGNVDARNLAKQLAKGKPLTGELKQAAEFAARFPKAAQTVEGMGSLPQTSPLDWATFGGIGAATANPFMLLGVGARPAARAAVLSNPIQRGLQNAPSEISPQLIEALRRGALSAPVAVTSQ